MTMAAHKPQKAKEAALKKTAKKTLKKSTASTKSKIKGISVGVRELRQSASQLLDQVKDGLVIEITEHGVPVARLVPITKSLYKEYLEAGLIIPAKNPTTHFDMPTFKLKGKKTSTQILMELRAEARY